MPKNTITTSDLLFAAKQKKEEMEKLVSEGVEALKKSLPDIVKRANSLPVRIGLSLLNFIGASNVIEYTPNFLVGSFSPVIAQIQNLAQTILTTYPQVKEPLDSLVANLIEKYKEYAKKLADIESLSEQVCSRENKTAKETEILTEVAKSAYGALFVLGNIAKPLASLTASSDGIDVRQAILETINTMQYLLQTRVIADDENHTIRHFLESLQKQTDEFLRDKKCSTVADILQQLGATASRATLGTIAEVSAAASASMPSQSAGPSPAEHTPDTPSANASEGSPALRS